MDSPAPSAADRPCLNCGAALVGPFCHACGQPDQPLDVPAREIARGAIGDVFAWDGRPSYAAHFVLSIHVFVVVILALAVIELVKLAWVLVPPHETFHHSVAGGSWILLGSAFLACYLYAALAVRRFYGVSLGKAVLSAPAVTVAPLVGWFGIIMAGFLLVLAWPA